MEFVTAPVIIIGLVVLYILSSIKVLREYERGVIFRLGRVLPKPKGPGIILVSPPGDADGDRRREELHDRLPAPPRAA